MASHEESTTKSNTIASETGGPAIAVAQLAMPSIRNQHDDDIEGQQQCVELEFASRHTRVTEYSSQGSPSARSLLSEPPISSDKSVVSKVTFRSEKPGRVALPSHTPTTTASTQPSPIPEKPTTPRDPSGTHMQSTSNRVITAASGTFVRIAAPVIPSRATSSRAGSVCPSTNASFRTPRSPPSLKEDHSRRGGASVCVSQATFNTYESDGVFKPVRRLFVPNRWSSARSDVSGDDTAGVMQMSTYKGATNYMQPQEEFLLSVDFHWEDKYGFDLTTDHPVLPTVVRPYMTPAHWNVFTQAAMGLARRNYITGTVYSTLGVLSVTVSLCYILYGVIPSDLGKYVAQHISIGAGIGLLVAGIALGVWGWANRGGVLMIQDMEALCLSASEQVNGMTVQFRSAEVLKETRKEALESDKTLAFGIELFCTEDATEELSHQGSDPPTPAAAALMPDVEKAGMDESHKTAPMDESGPDFLLNVSARRLEHDEEDGDRKPAATPPARKFFGIAGASADHV